MPKSKKQKQEEAIERKRAAFKHHIKWWTIAHNRLANPPSGASDIDMKLLKASAESAEASLVKAAYEAQVDRYGNPI
jgi:hypothetical protein